jgi:putative hydroxymethylpyrimidine transport system substrate-binding protein
MSPKIGPLPVVLATAALLLVGCGGGAKGEATESSLERFRSIRVVLDGKPTAEDIGVLMAQKRGYFYDFDLGVEELAAPAFPGRPIQYVTQRSVDLGISHGPQMELAQRKGAPIVTAGTVISRPTAAMIWLKSSGIDGIADLKGRTIAIPGLSFQRAFLGRALAQAGLTLEDVKVEVVNYDLVPSLVSGRADAIFGGSWNVEGVELEARGLGPVVTRVQDLDLPPYDELVVIGRRDLLAKDPRLARDFLSAVEHGTAAAARDPKAAVELLAEERSFFNQPPLGRKVLKAELEATLPLLSSKIRAAAP